MIGKRLVAVADASHPSWLLRVVAGLVIAANCLMLAVFVSGTIVEPNPFAILGGVFVVPFWVGLAVQEYRAIFRQTTSAAEWAAMLLYGAGGFLVFGIATSFVEVAAAKGSLRSMAGWAATVFAVALACFGAGILNSLWLRVLKAGVVESPDAVRGLSRTEKRVIAGIVVVWILTVVVLVVTSPPRQAEHVAAKATPFALPADAGDVCYRLWARGTVAYEFATNEESFRRWVEEGIGSQESMSANVPVKEIVEPFTIRRYGTGQDDSRDSITIEEGLYYRWTKEDRGVYAAYDRRSGRAYYHSHFH